jgi:hypothetical protein
MNALAGDQARRLAKAVREPDRVAEKKADRFRDLFYDLGSDAVNRTAGLGLGVDCADGARPAIPLAPLSLLAPHFSAFYFDCHDPTGRVE